MAGEEANSFDTQALLTITHNFLSEQDDPDDHLDIEVGENQNEEGRDNGQKWGVEGDRPAAADAAAVAAAETASAPLVSTRRSARPPRHGPPGVKEKPPPPSTSINLRSAAQVQRRCSRGGTLIDAPESKRFAKQRAPSAHQATKVVRSHTWHESVLDSPGPSRSQMEDVAASVEIGDTQYIPSQIYIDYIASKKATTDASHTAFASHANHGTSESEPRTYVTGDTGHVSLALDGEDDVSEVGYAEGKNSEEEGSEDELGQSQREAEEETVTSPAPPAPITPAVTGQKRDRGGNAVATSTPLGADNLATMFNAPTTKAGMGLSQIFGQTQGATSPPLEGPKSDPVFERPSPEFRMMYNRASPPLSSPVAPQHPEAQRAGTDPRDMYVSMKDSQEVRSRRRAHGVPEGLKSPSDASGDEDELGENSLERRAERKRRLAEIEAGARKDFEGLATSSAPIRLDGKSKSGKKDNIFQTPAGRSRAHGVVYISDDTPQINTHDEQTYDVSDVESRDEYDELSQAVISSSRRPETQAEEHGSREDYFDRPTSSPLPPGHGKEVEDTRLTHSFHGTTRGERSNGATPSNKYGLIHLGPSQSVKVADSQQDKADTQDESELIPNRPILHSSVNSRNFVSQSQDLSNSANLTTDLPPQSEIPESSSMPHAPRVPFTSETDNRERPVSESPRSSPPAMRPKAAKLSSESEVASSSQRAKSTIRQSKVALIEQSAPAEGPNDSWQELENQEPGISQDGRRAMAPGGNRKPIRTIVDTSPASTSNNQSSPQVTKVQTRRGAKAESTLPSDHPSKETNNESRAPIASRSNGAYDTAQTHQSSPLAAEQESEEEESPQVFRIKRLKSIGHNSVQQDQPSSYEMSFDILNEVDEEYQTAMRDPSQGNPPVKKPGRKSNRRQALQEPAPEANALPRHELEYPPSSDERRAHQAQSTESPVKEYPDSRPSGGAIKGKLKKPTPKAKRNLMRITDADISKSTTTKSKQAVNPAAEKDVADISGDQVPARESHSPQPASMQNRIGNVPALESSAGNGRTAPVLHPAQLVSDGNQGLASTKLVCPNRVFARFKGASNNYYPAVCLAKRGSRGSFTIKYDDGNIDDDLSASFVASLELRIGDTVKLDRNKLRNKEFIIRELQNPLPSAVTNGENPPTTDIYGHQSALVEPKQRGSKSGNDQAQEADLMEVQIAEIYLTSMMWPQFASRTCEFDQSHDADRPLQTPVDALSRAGTPSSRSRRHTLAASKKADASESLFALDVSSGLFSNMIFAISYNVKVKGREQEKNAVSKMVTENGGSLLSDSFEELFDKSSWLPPKGQEVNLKLLSTFANLGFAALITDNYSRRVKFIQALALDIPCLSGRWIMDSVAQQTVLPWTRYLLPAGESDLLSGAIRSRTFFGNTMPAPDATSAVLKDMVASRPNLIQGQNVIMVMEKKGVRQAEAKERRQLHVLLSCALGAGKVARVDSLASARKLLEQDDEAWAWLNVEDDAVEEARACLPRVDSTLARAKKRRTSARSVDLDGPEGGVVYPIKVVGEEFVVQSLIVGALINPAD